MSNIADDIVQKNSVSIEVLNEILAAAAKVSELFFKILPPQYNPHNSNNFLHHSPTTLFGHKTVCIYFVVSIISLIYFSYGPT